MDSVLSTEIIESNLPDWIRLYRTELDRIVQNRTGEDCTKQDWIRLNRTGLERTVQNRTGEECTEQDWIGLYRIGFNGIVQNRLDRTVQSRTG